MDAARVAKRSGAEEVYILYRKGFENMPCTKVELQEAKDDDIKFELFKAPIELTEEGVKLLEQNNEVKERKSCKLRYWKMGTRECLSVTLQ